jgi:hypothetical protein
MFATKFDLHFSVDTSTSVVISYSEMQSRPLEGRMVRDPRLKRPIRF